MIDRIVFSAIVTVALLGGGVGVASGQTLHAYRVEDLGSFGGDLYGQAINSQGDIGGFATMPDGSLHVIRWTAAGGLEDLGMNGGIQAQGFGMNDNGDIVGV